MQESVILWNQHRRGLGFTRRNGGRKTIEKFPILQLSQEKQREKHLVKPHCIGFLCFSCTKPNTPSNKIPLFFIPLFFTCIPIIFLHFSCSYVFSILCSKGSLKGSFGTYEKNMGIVETQEYCRVVDAKHRIENCRNSDGTALWIGHGKIIGILKDF